MFRAVLDACLTWLSGAQSANPEKSEKSQISALSNLDFLRSMAVVTVMIDHLVPTLIHHGYAVSSDVAAFTAHIGQAGVLAFFVHTSLVLMQSLERMAVHRRSTALVWRFYIRRFFRIYPLAMLVILVVLALGVPMTTWRANPPITNKVIIANLLLVQNLIAGQSVLGPLWSLPYEVEMYLVLPVLYVLARTLRGPQWLAWMIFIFCLIGHQISRLTGGHLNIFAYIPCFLSGVFCYALELHGRSRVQRRLPGWLWLACAPLMIVAYCLVHMSRPEPVYWIGWIFCLALGLTIHHFDGLPTASPISQWAELTAKYSYGIYLLHVPVLYVVYDRWQMHALLPGILIYFALTLLLSIAAFHAVEQPYMERGRRLTD